MTPSEYRVLAREVRVLRQVMIGLSERCGSALRPQVAHRLNRIERLESVILNFSVDGDSCTVDSYFNEGLPGGTDDEE